MDGHDENKVIQYSMPQIRNFMIYDGRKTVILLYEYDKIHGE